MVTKHWTDLPVLCGCFPLAIYFTFGSIYKSMPLSHFVPTYLSPSPCPQVHSLRLRLYSCPAPRFFRTICFCFFFRFHIYVLAYGIWFSLSDLLHSVWQTLSPSTSLQITQFRFFLWLSNILEDIFIYRTYFSHFTVEKAVDMSDLSWFLDINISLANYKANICMLQKY